LQNCWDQSQLEPGPPALQSSQALAQLHVVSEEIAGVVVPAKTLTKVLC